ncbi:MAG: hypothetical protein ABH864_05480 [archaeon]
MKKEMIFCLLILTLFSLSVIGQNLSDINISGRAIGNEVGNKTGEILQTEIIIPDYLQLLVWIITGIQRGAGIPLERFIVLAILWFFFFLLALQIIAFTPFETRWVRYVMAGGITIMLAVFGLINGILDFLFGWTGWFGGWGRWIVVLVLIVLIFVLKYVFGIIDRQNKLSHAEVSGIKVRTASQGLGQITEEAASAATSDEQN